MDRSEEMNGLRHRLSQQSAELKAGRSSGWSHGMGATLTSVERVGTTRRPVPASEAGEVQGN